MVWWCPSYFFEMYVTWCVYEWDCCYFEIKRYLCKSIRLYIWYENVYSDPNQDSTFKNISKNDKFCNFVQIEKANLMAFFETTNTKYHKSRLHIECTVDCIIRLWERDFNKVCDLRCFYSKKWNSMLWFRIVKLISSKSVNASWPIRKHEITHFEKTFCKNLNNHQLFISKNVK